MYITYPLHSSYHSQTVKNINKWNQVQEELSHDGDNTTTLVTLSFGFRQKTWGIWCLLCLSCMQATSVSASTVSTKAGSTPPPESEFEFSDTAALMCLLCARQFKSLDQLKRHNKESDLHKARNLNAVFRSSNIKLTFSFVLSPSPGKITAPSPLFLVSIEKL